MIKGLTEETIYQLSDDDIINAINIRFKKMRKNCLYTQKRLAEESGISIGTIKRIESSGCSDISIGTIIKLLRTLGYLSNIDNLIPEVPESPFKIQAIWTKS